MSTICVGVYTNVKYQVYSIDACSKKIIESVTGKNFCKSTLSKTIG